MFCKHCGKEIPEEDKFCGYCGLVLKKEEETDKEVQFEKETPIGKAEESLDYAGFWIRLGAFVFDYGLMLFFAIILSFVFGYIGLFWPAESNTIIGHVILIIYHSFFLAAFSATPGKMLYGLKVVDAKTQKNITFLKALGRSLSYIVSSLVFGLGFWTVAFDKPMHRAWHDRIAKTLVIRTKKKSLISPIILSIVAASISLWLVFSDDYFYDFSYGGVIELVQERVYNQPYGFCCSYVLPFEIKDYLKDIPTIHKERGDKTAEQIFDELSKAVITVGGETDYGEFYFGSGFLISPSGLVVTNFHIIEGMDRLAVALTGENIQLFDVDTIVAEDPSKDITVLKIDGENLPYIVMGDSDDVKIGQRLFTIGNPEGYTNTISEGIISQIREFDEGIKSFQITAPISQGSSGGALLNTKGEAIGVTNMIDWYGQNINFAIPINYIKDLIGLKSSTSEAEHQDSSGLIFCNGSNWYPCETGEEFHCPKVGDPFCCADVICHDECWESCLPWEEFYCPAQGDPYCK